VRRDDAAIVSCQPRNGAGPPAYESSDRMPPSYDVPSLAPGSANGRCAAASAFAAAVARRVPSAAAASPAAPFPAATPPGDCRVGGGLTAGPPPSVTSAASAAAEATCGLGGVGSCTLPRRRRASGAGAPKMDSVSSYG